MRFALLRTLFSDVHRHSHSQVVKGVVGKMSLTCARSVDLLGSGPQNLLEDNSILRLAFQGIVRYAHASPPCRDYSRLKLRPGGGPALCAFVSGRTG